MLYKIKSSSKFKSIVKELNTNVSNWKWLGRGSYGSAYDMGNGLVCKITSSIIEVRATRKLLRSKKRLKGLYRVIKSYLIKYNNKYYGIIITPKYKKLSIKQQNELFCLCNFLHIDNDFRLKSIKQVKALILAQIKSYHPCPKWYHNGICKCSADTFNDLLDKHMKIFRKYNIYGILKSLKAINLPAIDIHYLNVMRSGKHFLLIDIMT